MSYFARLRYLPLLFIVFGVFWAVWYISKARKTEPPADVAEIFDESKWRQYKEKDDQQKEIVKSITPELANRTDSEKSTDEKVQRRRFLGESIKEAFKKRGTFVLKFDELSDEEKEALLEWEDLNLSIRANRLNKKTPREKIDDQSEVSFNKDGLNNDRVRIETKNAIYSF